MEPILIEHLEEFKAELKEALSKQIETLLDQRFDHIDRVEKFINHKSKIGMVLNEEWVDEISQEFEKKAQSEYSRLYYKYASSHGKIIKEFKKIKSDQMSVTDVMKARKEISSHPIEIDYADIAAPLPMTSSKGDMIEYKTEQQFTKFLKARAASEPENLSVVPVSYSYDSPLDIAPTLKALLATPPATVGDALDFVADIQDKQEKEFLASGQDPTPLKSLSGNEFEDYLIGQYTRDYYTVDETLDLLLSPQGLLWDSGYQFDADQSYTPTLDSFDPRRGITP